MFIYIQDEILEFDNDPKVIIQILADINENLEKKELTFSHLVIDDDPIYDDYYNYFTKNIKDIKKVQVISQTITEIVNETLLSETDYLRNAIPLVNGLAEEFYQQPNEKTWLKLIDLFEGLQWIITSLTKIDSIKNLNNIIINYEKWNEYVQGVSQLGKIMPEIESAIIGKDIILIGDMLMYEIMPVLESLLDELKFLLPGKVENVVS